MFNSSENLAGSYNIKGTLSWLSEVHAMYIWLTELSISLVYVKIFQKRMDLIFLSTI